MIAVNPFTPLVYCAINPFTVIVIPAEAGIQKNRAWMPHQVRHDMPTKSKEALDVQHWDCDFLVHLRTRTTVTDTVIIKPESPLICQEIFREISEKVQKSPIPPIRK